MSTFFVRVASLVDVPSIKKIADANKTALGFMPKSKIDEATQQKRILVLLAEEELIGFVIFRHRKTDNQTTLSDICVIEAHRGFDGGRLLIESLIKNCVELGRSFIRLKCPVNLPSNQFYEKVGFKYIGVEKGKHRPLNIWQIDVNKAG